MQVGVFGKTKKRKKKKESALGELESMVVYDNPYNRILEKKKAEMKEHFMRAYAKAEKENGRA